MVLLSPLHHFFAFSLCAKGLGLDPLEIQAAQNFGGVGNPNPGADIENDSDLSNKSNLLEIQPRMSLSLIYRGKAGLAQDILMGELAGSKLRLSFFHGGKFCSPYLFARQTVS